MTQRYLVVAEFFSQFHNWCRENGMDPSNVRVKFAKTPHDFAGRRPPEWMLVKVGTWYNRADLLPYIAQYEALERSSRQYA